MSYKCTDCGNIFEEGEQKGARQDYGEVIYGCPICGGGYMATYPCEICGAEHTDEELSGGVCESCIDECRHDLGLCFELGNIAKTPLPLNSAITSLLSVEEIEEILKAYLLELHSIKPLDCSEFINTDKSWFGEQYAIATDKARKVEK